jgi:uncharacterized protein (DUF58 family)
MSKLKIGSGFALKRLDLVVKGLVDTPLLGNYSSVFKGVGLEFADYRVYNSGSDDASRIDWKASKRVGQVLVKEFVEERNLEIIFLVDVSSQMLTGSTKKLKAEYIAEFVSALSRSVLVSGDSVGLILFSDKIVEESRPKQGLVQFNSITKSLSDVSNYGGYSNIDNALDFVFKKGSDGALVVLVSDFIYGLRSEKLLRLASRKFDLISVMVRDPRDMTLPKGGGEVILEDPYSGSTLLINPENIGGDYARMANADVNKIRNVLQKHGSDFLFLETDKPFVKELVKFFSMRAAKWR